MIRCPIAVPRGKNPYCVTSCWEPLDDKGNCPFHGPQWMPIPRQSADSTPLSLVTQVTTKNESVVIQRQVYCVCNQCNPPVSLYSQTEIVQHDIKFHNRQWKG